MENPSFFSSTHVGRYWSFVTLPTRIRVPRILLFSNFLCYPLVTFTNSLHYTGAHSVDTNRTPVATSRTSIASVLPPIATGVALDGIRWWLVQLFFYVSFGRFLLLPLRCGKCDTRHTPITPIELLLPSLGVAERSKLTNKKQVLGKKQIIIGSRARRINWGVTSVNRSVPSGNTCHHTVKKWTGKHFEWIAYQWEYIFRKLLRWTTKIRTNF